MKKQKAAVDPSNVKCVAGDAVFGCLASLRLNAFKIIRIHGLRCLCLLVSSQCEELTQDKSSYKGCKRHSPWFDSHIRLSSQNIQALLQPYPHATQA